MAVAVASRAAGEGSHRVLLAGRKEEILEMVAAEGAAVPEEALVAWVGLEAREGGGSVVMERHRSNTRSNYSQTLGDQNMTSAVEAQCMCQTRIL